jgi:cholesterol oxidase
MSVQVALADADRLHDVGPGRGGVAAEVRRQIAPPGEVFGQKNLYVMDGAVIPRAIGRNPSKTIAAIAERCCERLGVRLDQERRATAAGAAPSSRTESRRSRARPTTRVAVAEQPPA